MVEKKSTPRRQQKRKLGRRSPVWENFILFTDEHGKEKARCKRCSKVLNAGQGTNSPSKHVRICSEQEASGARTGARPPPPPAPSHPAPLEHGLDEADKLLAQMIASSGYDPSVLEDHCFRSFVASLNPKFKVPLRVDIEKMCDGIIDEARKDLFFRLFRFPGRLSISMGKAKTLEREVSYIACHFIDEDWKLHKLVMGAFVMTDDFHTDNEPIFGVYVHFSALDQLLAVLGREYRGLEDVLCIVTYKKNDDDYAHDLWKCNEERSNSGSSLTREISYTIYVDEVLHSIARCFFPEKSSFTPLMSHGMYGLGLTRQKRQQLLSSLGLDNPCAYGEDWYACYCSLKILCNKGFSSVGDDSLLTQLLCNVWGKIYGAIQRISDLRYPTSNLCLDEFLNVRKVLLSELAKATGDYYKESQFFSEEDMLQVLEDAKGTLDKAIQDSYLIWSVPLILDPRYKLRLYLTNFCDAFGSEDACRDYFSQVTQKIKKLYDDYSEDGSMAVVSSDPLQQASGDEHCQEEAQTELDRYLNDPLAEQTQDFDILNWWKEHSTKYPTVAGMARDALAMPTCSKLSSDQIAHVRSILRGYSNEAFRDILSFSN